MEDKYKDREVQWVNDCMDNIDFGFLRRGKGSEIEMQFRTIYSYMIGKR